MYLKKESRAKLGKKMDDYMREIFRTKKFAGVCGVLWGCQMAQRKMTMRI